MTVDYQRSRDDVVTWPTDPRARRALEEWFNKLDASPAVHPTLAAGELDFSGADLSGLDIGDADWVSATLRDNRLRWRRCSIGWGTPPTATRTESQTHTDG
ncbi:hypothetical protein [Rhodococcoides yunnanense]|uniref:hypothetical protein n=1 Tax=Rhodococcoides yunnanense TaxID=278209 RepID=UPI000932432C|nr:hypothetical protein [Rhodococcus yunnanensis]